MDAVPLEVATSLTQLEHLDLSFNQISELPPRFGELRRLRHLDLSHNDIEEFPNEGMEVLASVTVRSVTVSINQSISQSINNAFYSGPSIKNIARSTIDSV